MLFFLSYLQAKTGNAINRIDEMETKYIVTLNDLNRAQQLAKLFNIKEVSSNNNEHFVQIDQSLIVNKIKEELTSIILKHHECIDKNNLKISIYENNAELFILEGVKQDKEDDLIVALVSYGIIPGPCDIKLETNHKSFLSFSINDMKLFTTAELFSGQALGVSAKALLTTGFNRPTENKDSTRESKLTNENKPTSGCRSIFSCFCRN